MSFRLVPKSVTLYDVMAVTLRYFTEFGKLALRETICGGIYARVFCIFSACTMSSQRKFTFAISSPGQFLVILKTRIGCFCGFCYCSQLVQQYCLGLLQDSIICHQDHEGGGEL